MRAVEVMMSGEALLQSSGVAWASGNSSANGTLRLFADRLEWVTGLAPLQLKPLPNTTIPVAEIVETPVTRAGLSHRVDVRTASQKFEFMLRRSWNPFATRALAQTWADSIALARKAVRSRDTED